MARKIELREAFKDKAGNVFYEYADPLQIPSCRAVAAEIALRFSEMKLTEEELRRLIKVMKNHANKGNIVDLFAVLKEIEVRLDFIAEEKTLMELGMVYSVMNDEDETAYAKDQQQKKMKALEADPEAKGFFLQWAFGYTRLSLDISQEDINASLIQAAMHDQKINRYS
jgi:cell division protein FtsI/penicillin-binding protein 2